MKWTGHAKAQLRHIYDYVAQDSATYAKRVTQELVNRSLSLDELPRAGKVVAELNNELVREVSLYSYRILYEIKHEVIEVLAVIHKRRDVQADEIPRGE
ncbi:MAG TPA: type II toxin-antitoxin system RelE/ParE family toxin [Cellvibrionaceae bacterium]|nr:type II toxin-antitoxin system RelE/ParE family toxin [Cellvibrionaceae bacterium]